MNDISSLDKMLEQICQKGKICSNFIRDYSEEVSNELESKGYIKKISLINYEEFEATDAGKSFYRSGGFKGAALRENEKLADRILDNRSKYVSIDTSIQAIKLAKRANVIAIIAIILSLVVIIIEILKLI